MIMMPLSVEYFKKANLLGHFSRPHSIYCLRKQRKLKRKSTIFKTFQMRSDQMATYFNFSHFWLSEKNINSITYIRVDFPPKWNLHLFNVLIILPRMLSNSLIHQQCPHKLLATWRMITFLHKLLTASYSSVMVCIVSDKGLKPY